MDFDAKYLVRPAKFTDAKALAVLGAVTFYSTYSWYNTPEDMQSYIDNNFTISKLEEELADKTLQFVVIEASNSIIAYMKLSRVKNAYMDDMAYLEIARLYVDDAFKGRHFGKKLLVEAEKIALDEGFEALWLGVWTKNEAAQAFYKHLGFIQAGNVTFTLGSDVQEDFIFIKHLV